MARQLTVDERFLNSFGKREVELAAINIYDGGFLDRAMTKADVLRVTRSDPTGYVADGFDLLVEWGWLVPSSPGLYRATELLAERVRAAQAIDDVYAEAGRSPASR